MKTWSQEQQIEFEFTRDVISSMSALFTRHKHWLKEIGKANTPEEKEYIQKLEQRRVELSKEKKCFDGFDTELMKKIQDIYTPLLKEYGEVSKSDEGFARTNRLDERYFNTKLIDNEYKDEI